MGFLLGLSLLLFGVSFTSKEATTTVKFKAYSLPTVNKGRGDNPLVINNVGVEISRTF